MQLYYCTYQVFQTYTVQKMVIDFFKWPTVLKLLFVTSRNYPHIRFTMQNMDQHLSRLFFLINIVKYNKFHFALSLVDTWANCEKCGGLHSLYSPQPTAKLANSQEKELYTAATEFLNIESRNNIQLPQNSLILSQGIIYSYHSIPQQIKELRVYTATTVFICRARNYIQLPQYSLVEQGIIYSFHSIPM